MLSRVVKRVLPYRAGSSQFRKFTTETVHQVQEKAEKNDQVNYMIMGSILGGIGVGVPLSYFYFFAKYELEWHKRMHGNLDVPK